MSRVMLRGIVISGLMLSLAFLIGCAGMEFAPKDPYPYWYYPKELPEADRAVNDAQKAGKDKECPKEFAAAKELRDKAYEIYAACRTDEAIKMAKDATAKAKALCPKKAEPPKVIDKLTLRVLFDFDKSDVRKSEEAELKKAADFVKKYPKSSFKVEGHTCDMGSDQYNQKLSERRAAAVKDYLIKNAGVDKGKITSAGYGESKPVADNKTKEGRIKNRRVEVLVLSE